MSIYICIPITLWALPATYFDNGKTVCVSKTWLNIECYGCGMTRAVMRLMHFRFQEAWEHNKLSFLVLPVLGLLWLKMLMQELGIRILKWL